MATILKIQVNDVDYEKSAATLEMLRDVMTTANPAAMTVTKAANLAGESYPAAFLAAGNATDVFSVIEDSTVKAVFSRKQIAEKIRIALSVESWQGKIMTERGEPVAKKDKGSIEV